MSESTRRRDSSRQLLENLIRVTAQRSQEDAEEVERERRRRSRERDRGEDSGPQDNRTDDPQLEEELKPSSSSSSSSSALEEDEGFGDWSHRMENRGEQEVSEEWRRRRRAQTTPPLERKAEPAEEEEEEESHEASPRSPEVSSSTVKVSSSAVFLPEPELQPSAGGPAHRNPVPVAGVMESGAEGQEERQEEPRFVETRWRSEGAQRSDEEEEEGGGGGEELSLEEAAAEAREEEEEEEEQEEACRRPASSSRDEEALTCYGPMSPTFKKLLIQFYPDEATSRASTDGKCTIIERTESLKKSTNSVRRTPFPVTVSKIDKKLEQYTHALEVSSKENRSGTPVLADLTAAAEPVSSKKSLFEGGEAWNQNAASVTPSKDTDGLKVGVADLINQWVRGGEHGSRCSSPFKPADSSPCKRYRFVVTGHGKYEKVSVDGCEDTNSQSARRFYQDL